MSITALNAIQSDPFESLNNLVPLSPQAQRALLITAIATAVILSLAGILSSGLLVAAIVAPCVYGINQLLARLMNWILAEADKPKTNAPSELLNSEPLALSTYAKKMVNMTPFTMAVMCPAAEEVLFRGVLQDGCQLVLEKMGLIAGISILGLPFSLGALGAILIASIAFGAIHYSNEHSGADRQAILSTVSGISYGVLNYYYGLPAAFLAHCINNLICEIRLHNAMASWKEFIPAQAIRV